VLLEAVRPGWKSLHGGVAHSVPAQIANAIDRVYVDETNDGIVVRCVHDHARDATIIIFFIVNWIFERQGT